MWTWVPHCPSPWRAEVSSWGQGMGRHTGYECPGAVWGHGCPGNSLGICLALCVYSRRSHTVCGGGLFAGIRANATGDLAPS